MSKTHGYRGVHRGWGLGAHVEAQGQRRPGISRPRPLGEIPEERAGGDVAPALALHPRSYTNGLNCINLAALTNASGTARRYAKAVLDYWGLNQIIPVAELVLSELVTNAVQAVGIVDAHPTYVQLQDVTLISVCIYRHAGRLVEEVWDPSRQPPVAKEAGPEDEGGRGLAIIDALGESWGYRWPSTGGKIVWCSIPML